MFSFLNLPKNYRKYNYEQNIIFHLPKRCRYLLNEQRWKNLIKLFFVAFDGLGGVLGDFEELGGVWTPQTPPLDPPLKLVLIIVHLYQQYYWAFSKKCSFMVKLEKRTKFCEIRLAFGKITYHSVGFSRTGCSLKKGQFFRVKRCMAGGRGNRGLVRHPPSPWKIVILINNQL